MAPGEEEREAIRVGRRDAPHNPDASLVQLQQPTLPGPAALICSFRCSLSTWVTSMVALGQRLKQ